MRKTIDLLIDHHGKVEQHDEGFIVNCSSRYIDGERIVPVPFEKVTYNVLERDTSKPQIISFLRDARKAETRKMRRAARW